MCLALRPLGSSEDPRGKFKLSLFQQQALFQGCVTASCCPVCSFPFQLQMLLPQGRPGNLHHEVCTAKTSAAPLLPAPPGTASLCSATDTQHSRNSPQDGEVTLSRETTLLGFLGHADMTERDHINCCFYWGKAFNKGDGTTPSHRIRNRGERGEEQDNWAEEL